MEVQNVTKALFSELLLTKNLESALGGIVRTSYKIALEVFGPQK
jgi:hypothetical protein